MSYKSLLFCPDGRTAQLVTQVLSELDFTVELSNEPFAAVKKLTDQHFDALVVDIANEQDASLLFKSARDSSFNHSSLSVAVVEGQAGVAKAFRIGANLVLTKPVNIEQSKSTLRVARGLLRKNEAKPTGVSALVTPGGGTQPSAPARPALAMPVIPVASAAPIPAPHTASADSFSMLEVEKEPVPAPEAAEVALLESMHDPNGAKSSEQNWAPRAMSSAEPIAASTSGHSAGAAAAPALEKVAPAPEKPVIELKSAPPLASQETIVAAPGAAEHFELDAPPTFSYGQETSQSGSGNKVFKIVAIVVVVVGLAYAAWQRFQLGQYLSMRASIPSAPSEPIKPSVETAPERSPASSLQSTVAKENHHAETLTPNPETVAADPNPVPSPRATTNSQPESIDVQELPLNPEPKITVVPKPLVVNTKARTPQVAKAAPPAPPTITVADSSAASQTLASIVSTNVALPQPMPGTLRVSQGVSQGLIMKKVAPIYPPTALQLRRQGTVEVLATINKNGSISRIKVLSGDPVLAKSATDSVRQWKYRPYLLNGEPVEVETQVTINFKLPN